MTRSAIMKKLILVLVVCLGGCGAGLPLEGSDVTMRASITETAYVAQCGLVTRTFPAFVFPDGHMVGTAQEVDLSSVGPAGEMGAFREDAGDFYGYTLAPGSVGHDYGINFQVSGQTLSGTSWEEIRSDNGQTCEVGFQVSGNLF
jgi:hypothetical protein